MSSVTITAPIVTSFPSIQAFQDHFRHNEELPIPANQPLEIRNISIVTEADDNSVEGREVWPQDTLDKVRYILNKMLCPLGKGIVCFGFEGHEVSLNEDRLQIYTKIDDNFFLRFDRDG